MHLAIPTAQYWTRMNRWQAQHSSQTHTIPLLPLYHALFIYLITFSPHSQISVSHDLSRHFLSLRLTLVSLFLCLSGLVSFHEEWFCSLSSSSSLCHPVTLASRSISGSHSFSPVSLAFVSDLSCCMVGISQQNKTRHAVLRKIPVCAFKPQC